MAYATIPNLDASVYSSSSPTTQMNNNVIAQINENFAQVLEQLAGISSNTALVQYNAPIKASGSDAAVRGDLVYYDTTDGCYKPAAAVLGATMGSNGAIIEAPSAHVAGLVLSNNGTSATLMLGGFWRDSDLAQQCLVHAAGAAPLPGVYYLSSSAPGKAQLLSDDILIRQPLISYDGNGGISLSLFYQFSGNHFHRSATLEDAWTAVSWGGTPVVSTPPGAPSGASWYYDLTLDDSSALAALGELNDAYSQLFYNGALLQPGVDYTIGTTTISSTTHKVIWWLRSGNGPVTGATQAFNQIPFGYGEAVVRAVISAADSPVTATTNNGTVVISGPNFTTTSTAPAAQAVASITGDQLALTPVVSSLTAGPGINLTAASDGSITVASSNQVGTPLDAYTVNHNGTATTVIDNIYNGVVFPIDATTNFIMSMPVYGVSGGSYKATAWAASYGTAANLSVKMWFVAAPTATAAQTIPTATSDSETLSFSGAASGKTAYGEVATGLTITQDGMLYAQVSATNPAAAITLLRQGFRLTVVEG